MILPWLRHNYGKCVLCCVVEVPNKKMICEKCRQKYKTDEFKIKERLHKLGYI